CFYIINLFHEKRIGNLSIIALLLSLESCLHYGLFGIPLLYLIPATFIGMLAQKLLYTTRLQPYILLTACLLTQGWLIEPVFLHIPAINSYTNLKIIANIIVMI